MFSGDKLRLPMIRPAIAALFAAALVSCGGSQHAAYTPISAPNGGNGAQSMAETIAIEVSPPSSMTGSAAEKTVSYFSPNAQSLNYFIYSSKTGAQVATGTLANLTPSSTNCTTNSSGTVCTISVNLAPGSYYATVATYSASNGHGPVLSIQEYIPFTVAQNGSISTPVWTLWGVPKTITATATTTPYVRTAGGITTTYGTAAVQYAIVSYDQTNAPIVGAGVPTWTVASSNSAFHVAAPTTQSPNAFSVTPGANLGPIGTTLTVTGSFPGSRIDFCRIVGANCASAPLTLNALNVLSDDWVTFAHDYQRTGLETQQTGLSRTTASKLALRWHVQVPNGAAIQANPAVYDGNVIVVTTSGIAYDLSAIDGSVIWSRTLDGPSLKPATIDPLAGAHGLVFVGTRLTSNDKIVPSTYYALNLSDGSIAWQTTLNADTRSSEVIANGNIYIGTAGGDPPQCLNAGVQQVNEATGQVGWTWYVNSVTNPNGGGAVWGAISYDGSRLFFGTGNVCQQSGTSAGQVPTADGEAILDLSGKLVTSFVAWMQTGPNAVEEDYDTGGSVLIENMGTSNETATFLNKNSTLYRFLNSGLSANPPSNVLQKQFAVNPNYGYGFYTSPTSDGTYTVIQTGAYSNSTSSSTVRSIASGRGISADIFTPFGGRRPSRIVAGYHSFLQAFDANGNSKWAFQMQSFIAGYAAINNGVVVSQGDNAVIALDITGNGQPLWSYTTAGQVDCSPAVVPSGIYIADNNGNVYAFAPPYATVSPTAAARRPL